MSCENTLGASRIVKQGRVDDFFEYLLIQLNHHRSRILQDRKRYVKHFYTKQIQIYMKSNVARRPNRLIQNNAQSTI